MRVIEALLLVVVGAAIGYYIKDNVTCKTFPWLSDTTVCIAKTG